MQGFSGKIKSGKEGISRANLFLSNQITGVSEMTCQKISYNRGVGKTTEERFWSRVDKTSNANGCWEWTGYVKSNGYAQVAFNHKKHYAHRYSFFLKHKYFPDLLVLHKCDNRKCVNPDHLFTGTHKENTADMIRKNRHAKGERSNHTTLTANQIPEIWKMLRAGVLQRVIANKFGVTPTTISLIKRRINWKHIQAPD